MIPSSVAPPRIEKDTELETLLEFLKLPSEEGGTHPKIPKEKIEAANVKVLHGVKNTTRSQKIYAFVEDERFTSVEDISVDDGEMPCALQENQETIEKHRNIINKSMKASRKKKKRNNLQREAVDETRLAESVAAPELEPPLNLDTTGAGELAVAPESTPKPTIGFGISRHILLSGKNKSVTIDDEWEML